MNTFLKSFFSIFLLIPSFIISMDPDYPQLQLEHKQNEKKYTGTLQMDSLPMYCTNRVHQSPTSETYKFNLAENNPVIACQLVPTDRSEYENMTIMIPAQHLFNCNDGSTLDLSFRFTEDDNTQKLIHFQALCKKSDEEIMGPDFVTQFTNAMGFFYQNGAGTTRMFLPNTIESLVASEIIKKERQPQDREFILNNDDGTTQRISMPLYKLEHGNKGCSSDDDFKHIMMKKNTIHYGSNNVLAYLMDRETGKPFKK